MSINSVIVQSIVDLLIFNTAVDSIELFVKWW